jgi:hypothetical protein
MNNFYNSIYKSLTIASVIAFFISFFTSGTVAYGSVLSGLSVLILSIMMILLLLITKTIENNISNSKILFQIIKSTGPFLIMLGVIGLFMYLMIINKKSIVDNHVSQNYYSFSKIIILLLLLQIYLFSLNNINFYLLYLFGILSSIASIILYIILEYYKTDG